MIKRCLLALGCLALLPCSVRAQATSAASRQGAVQVGLGLTSANSDYVSKRIGGITGYGTLDLTPHFGLEADIHYLGLKTPQDFGENSYEIGGRYVFRYARFEPYAKALLGLSSTDFQQGFYQNPHSRLFFEYALGGGLDIRLGHHINLRAIDFEYQQWPTFPPNHLTPALITVGAAYRLR